MKKSISKKIVAILMAVAMMVSVLAIQPFAANTEKAIQKWDFTVFEDGTYIGTEDANELISSDGKVSLGVGNPYWNLSKSWTVSDSVMTFNSTKYSNKRHLMIIALRLEKDLKAGETYKLATDMTISLTGSWTDYFAVYYAPTLASARSGEVNAKTLPSDCTALYTKTSGFNKMPQNEFEFTPAADMVAGGYLAFRVRVETPNTFTAVVSDFSLTQIIPEYPYMINDTDAIYDEWDFTKLEDCTFAYNADEHDPKISSDERIVLGVNNAQNWWNKFSDLTIENGVITQTFKGHSSFQNEFMIHLKLDTDLVAGKEYTFVSDLDCIRNEVEGTNYNIYPGFYYTPVLKNGVDGNEIYDMPDDAVELYQVARSTTGLANLNDFTCTFTPETTLSAGGYLCFRVKTWYRHYTFSLSNAKIVSKPTNVLKSYDLTTEEDRALLLSSRETTLTEHSFGEDTVFNWNQGGLGFSDFDFVAGKTYILTFNYSSGIERTLNLWQSPKDNFVDSASKWIKNDLTTFAPTGGHGVSHLGYHTVVFTAPAVNEGNTLYFYNSYPGGTFPIKGITISEYQKAIPASSAPATPADDNRAYTKIVLPEIDTAIMQYSMVNENGDYIALDGNVADGLDYDTEYKFVVKYFDSYRFYESDYSEAITVKTRKLGDVTGEGITNIVDLVRLKKGIVNMNESPIYDVDPSGDNSASLIMMRRIILGLVK